MEKELNEIQQLSQAGDFSFADQWYEIADENHFYMLWRLRALLNLAKDIDYHLHLQHKGLEIGCGNGIVRQQVEQHTNWIVDGADLHLESLKMNKKGRGKLFLYNILEKKEGLKEHYDFIILFDVLEHIENSQQFLASTFFHLKKGGILFINVPAIQCLFSHYDTAMGHLRRYSKLSIKSEVLHLNAKVLDIRYIGLSALPLLILRKMLQGKDQPSSEAIRKGFKPPTPWIHACLRTLMRCETQILKKPFLGTSIMAAIQK